MKNKENNMNEFEDVCCCCGLSVVEVWDICEICMWQSDTIQNNDPDYSGGANVESLNEYRAKWLESQKGRSLA